MVTREQFVSALKERETMVVELFNEEHYRQSFRPEPLREAVYSYINRPAKRFRPGILFFCCGAVGGKEMAARLAAAAVEVYHTWTLVHDDIIDNDPRRRGQPTIHEEFRLKAQEWGYPDKEAADLGRNVAILTGDLQHAWAVRLLLDSASLGVPLPVVLDLVRRMEVDVTNRLLEGEALDVLFARRPIAELTEAEVLRMLELKTGVLYEYAGIAGASIGLGKTLSENGLIAAVGRFALKCGTAFQLQDDILGITGDEARLGKKVGSDIREGKRTTIVLHAYHNAGPAEREFLDRWLGNPYLGEQEVAEIRRILIDFNGIEYTRGLAESIVADALEEIGPLPDSLYKELLLTWANYVVNRDF
ncbi:farnesyl-diphosphate synthase /geranylgeranyl-diphosphate synthase [Hydrogenispora ethanolica]|jgi:geranylgeranyl diphosphate synthase type I|uniref:Farnesyl-diphosphate synthase /geranylgeranyl-diphosphate synthase n=1 Tax=Hydrogenispora ethanolica TaxID=1082276 RepID=A0A4V2QDM5_HYDET|nr:polyprenyl synthetase family protein [Hydrogenispora ethanolica]TCL64747.1 farnesyl-diphosphate synthase /geranylgeranyl-diphosphate synthase [Hydrogenispora ethanolica]